MDNKKNKNEPEEMDFKVSSSTDLTGMLTSGYGTEEDLDDLNEMYNFINKPIVNTDKESRC